MRGTVGPILPKPLCIRVVIGKCFDLDSYDDDDDDGDNGHLLAQFNIPSKNFNASLHIWSEGED